MKNNQLAWFQNGVKGKVFNTSRRALLNKLKELVVIFVLCLSLNYRNDIGYKEENIYIVQEKNIKQLQSKPFYAVKAKNASNAFLKLGSGSIS